MLSGKRERREKIPNAFKLLGCVCTEETFDLLLSSSTALLIELFLRGYEQALGARLNSMAVLNAFPP